MESYLQWAMSQFFLFSTFGDMEVQSFSVFPRWRPYHVTYDVIIWAQYIRGQAKYVCKVWRFYMQRCRRSAANRQTDKQMKNRSETEDLPEFTFLSDIQDKYGGRTTWPMTSTLTYFIPHGEFFTMSHVSIFSVQYFRRYRGAKFFGFSKMAAVPRDWWRHN